MTHNWIRYLVPREWTGRQALAAVELLSLLGKPLSAIEQEKALAIVRSNGGIAAPIDAAREWVARAEAACDLLPNTPAPAVLRVAPAALLAQLPA